MIKLRYLILILLIGFIALFVLKFPASSAIALAGVDQDPNMEFRDIRGTVWNGKTIVRHAQFPRTMHVSWDFSWKSVLTLLPRAHIQLDDKQGTELTGNLALTSKALDVQDMNGTLSPSILESIPQAQTYGIEASSPIEITAVNLKASPTSKEINTANGVISWQGGKTQYKEGNTPRTLDLNPMEIQLSDKEGALQGTLKAPNIDTEFGRLWVDLRKSWSLMVKPSLLKYQDQPYPRNMGLDDVLFETEMLF